MKIIANQETTLTMTPIRFATLGLILAALSGCSANRLGCAGWSPDQSTQSADPASIKVSIDGSGSMKGFAAVKGSELSIVLEELDSSLRLKTALGTSNSSAKIFRIGRDTKGKTSNIKIDSLLAARNPEFFEGGDATRKLPKVSSSLDQFVGNDSNSLDILISDLEPDNAAIGNLIGEIMPRLSAVKDQKLAWWQVQGKKRNNMPAIELVLIGIKSAFSGTVYPATKDAFIPYPHYGQRPFYLLMLGNQERLEKIVTQLTEIQALNAHLQITRFAAGPYSGLTQFVDPAQATFQPNSCMGSVFTINQGLKGKLVTSEPNHWAFTKRMHGCGIPSVQISLHSTPLIGFGGIKATDPMLLSVGANAQITSMSLNRAGLSAQFIPQVPIGSLALLDISLNAEKDDRQRWDSWSSSGNSTDGSRTQRLSQLIRRFRVETNELASHQGVAAYSPVRLCAAVQN